MVGVQTSLSVVDETILEDAPQDEQLNGADSSIHYTEAERRNFGERLSKLGLDIAVSADIIEEITTIADGDREQFKAFVGELDNLKETTNEISMNVTEATNVASRATQEISSSRASVDEARTEIERMIEAVNASEQRMQELSSSIENVGGIINVIYTIAKQTNLLALNATIEAARAGEAGKGFSVVASEVKALAKSTSEATTKIEETLEEIKSGFDLLSSTSKQTSERAFNVGEKTETFGQMMDAVSTAMETIDRKTGIIDQQMGVVNEACEEFIMISEGVSNNLGESSHKLSGSSKTMRKVSDETDEMVLKAALDGRNHAEHEIIQKAKWAAEKSIALIDEGIRHGQVSMNDLFDRDHDLIEGSNPAQHLAKYSSFIDSQIQPVIEEVVASHEKIAWCATIDDTAYITANILAVSKPQTDDPVWNMANCRNHRYFPDRAAKRAGANSEGFLLQTYRRDMGGGNFVPMKDISYPIIIQGRHWGAFRVGYVP